MRFSTTLLVVAAAGLFATGHAASDLSQTKIFQAQGVSQFAGGVKSVVTGGRLLRAAYGEDEEERGAWTALLARFPGTTANLARKAEKQTKKIKLYADDFAAFLAKDKDPYDVTVAYMAKGFSDNRAFKMGLRYETYMKNPSLYHQKSGVVLTFEYISRIFE